jgi:RimJ/RimL family protein N-acetyltransferase
MDTRHIAHGGSESEQLVDVRALTLAEQAAIAGWRYPGRYATYDFDDPSVLTRDHWAVTSGGTLVGYCCFHDAARVGGVTERPGTLDVGYGLAPDRMGAGTGRRFVAAILDFAVQTYEPDWLRMFILHWNQRSLTVATRHGFMIEGSVESDEREFVVMGRPARPANPCHSRSQ